MTEQTGVSGVGFANCAWGKETVYFTFLKLQYNLLHFLRGMKKGNPKGPWRVEGVLVVTYPLYTLHTPYTGSIPPAHTHTYTPHCHNRENVLSYFGSYQNTGSSF